MELRIVDFLILIQLSQCIVEESYLPDPNLARLAVAGRLLVIMLDKSQAPITLFQRSVASHLESIPEDLADVRRGLGGLAAQVESLAAAIRGMK